VARREATIAAVALLAAASEAQSPGVISSGFLFEDAPSPRCHASTIEETGRGLVAAWFGGTEEGHEDVAIWVSRHAGGRWSTPAAVQDGVQHSARRHPTWNPVLFQPSDGPLLLFYKCGPRPSSWWGMLSTSADGGASWSHPRRLPEEILGPVRCKPIELAGGELLCGSSEEHSGWTVHFERTGDLGRSWSRTLPVGDDAQELSAIQPTLLDLGDRGLMALCRTKQGRVGVTTSADLGRSWDPIRLTSLPNPNSGIDAVSLRDGRALLVYNHTERGRSPLNVAVSSDGVSWQAAAVLEHEPGEYSYPAVIQARDGLVHVTYTWNRERIRHVVIDPAALEPRVMTGGVWPR